MRYKPVDRTLFIENRQRLVNWLKPGSIAVFNSSDIMPTSADGIHPFVQQTDLFYLSGIDQEESILVIYPDAPDKQHREILFIRKTNSKIATWEGPKYTKQQAIQISGIQTVYWSLEFETVFRSLVFEAGSIYLNTNEHPRAQDTVESRDTRFIRWCRDQYPLHAYERLAPIMHHLRATKSPVETDLIKKAVSITDGAFKKVLGMIKPGIWEFEIEAELYHEFLKHRSRGPAYQPIVASGKNTCILHYVKNDRQLKDGDMVLMDFGAEYAGYASDLTRTVPANGKFTPRQRQVYQAVLNIQKAAIDMLRPGNTLESYHRAVGKIAEREMISLGLIDAQAVKHQTDKNPLYKRYLPHGISHHLGLDVHDYGNRYRKFEPGMVFTCEPGIYIKKESLGIRLENDILITETDPVDLTASVPIEPDEIEALMGAACF